MDADATRSQLAAALVRVASGDRAALRLVYQDTSAKLFGVCLRILKDRGEAEDVLQEVFVTVWRKAASFDPGRASPITWMVAIARNRAIDRLRANQTRDRTVSALLPEDATPAVAQPLASDEQLAILRALSALSAEQRDLIELAYFQGMTHAELAERFGLPLGTVKTRVRNGLLTLRRELALQPAEAEGRIS